MVRVNYGHAIVYYLKRGRYKIIKMGGDKMCKLSIWEWVMVGYFVLFTT